jgi:hypothetical protein
MSPSGRPDGPGPLAGPMTGSGRARQLIRATRLLARHTPLQRQSQRSPVVDVGACNVVGAVARMSAATSGVSLSFRFIPDVAIGPAEGRARQLIRATGLLARHTPLQRQSQRSPVVDVGACNVVGAVARMSPGVARMRGSRATSGVGLSFRFIPDVAIGPAEGRTRWLIRATRLICGCPAACGERCRTAPSLTCDWPIRRRRRSAAPKPRPAAAPRARPASRLHRQSARWPATAAPPLRA